MVTYSMDDQTRLRHSKQDQWTLYLDQYHLSQTFTQMCWIIWSKYPLLPHVCVVRTKKIQCQLKQCCKLWHYRSHCMFISKLPSLTSSSFLSFLTVFRLDLKSALELSLASVRAPSIASADFLTLLRLGRFPPFSSLIFAFRSASWDVHTEKRFTLLYPYQLSMLPFMVLAFQWESKCFYLKKKAFCGTFGTSRILKSPIEVSIKIVFFNEIHLEALSWISGNFR